jgi:hypothetical protein
MPKTNNPCSGIVGVMIRGPGGVPVTGDEPESVHFYACAECGQMVDRRDLGQVFHHEQSDHEPLQLDS